MKAFLLLSCTLFLLKNDGSVEEEEEVEDDRAARICRNDTWWDDKISDNEDVFDVDYREKWTGTSK